MPLAERTAFQAGPLSLSGNYPNTATTHNHNAINKKTRIIIRAMIRFCARTSCPDREHDYTVSDEELGILLVSEIMSITVSLELFQSMSP